MSTIRQLHTELVPVLFLRMDKIIRLILFCQIILVRASPSDFGSLLNRPRKLRECHIEHASSPKPMELLRLGIVGEAGSILRIALRKKEHVLANENLPVWTFRKIAAAKSALEKDHYQLERNYEVMKQLGEFTIYQEPETSSAAIYFHKRREFDGMIGYELLIRKLSADVIHPKIETLITSDELSIYKRPSFIRHDEDPWINDPTAGVNNQKQMKTYGSRVYEGYPEVLVIVSWDVANDWTQNVDNADYYTTIVSQVLTLFNGVDMLYSKLKRTKISINIAGVVIVNDEYSFSHLQRCYHLVRSETGHAGYWMDVGCVNQILRLYLKDHMEQIPPDSFDLAIFLTREDLFKPIWIDDWNYNSQHVVGAASNVDDLYGFRKSGERVILSGAITSREYLENYSVISHELAHMMTVKHDPPMFHTRGDKCCGYLMKTVGVYCNRCLSWSEISEETFHLFFSSPHCCEFINPPRSLRPSVPSLMLTADEQCRCYGYESTRKFAETFRNFCRINLQCEGRNGLFHNIVLPMDGTPCRSGKVCWRIQCLELEPAEVALAGDHDYS